jgi:hypothetical protein
MSEKPKLQLISESSAKKKKEPIVSIVSFKIKHLARLHEAILRERSQIHQDCDVLERQKHEIDLKYDKALKNLRKIQREVEKIEHEILMENIKKNYKGK